MWPAIACFGIGASWLAVQPRDLQTGWTSYPPLLVPLVEAAPGSGACTDLVADRSDFGWCVVNDGVCQLHDDHHQHAGTRHDPVPHATDDLVDVHHRDSAGIRTCLF